MIKSFKKLLGNGRAWRLFSKSIKQASHAFLKPFKDLQALFWRISKTPFPTNNDAILGDIVNYETLFDVSTKLKNPIERANNVEMQWSLVGGQGWGYIQNVINAANLPIKVIENLPVRDLSADVAVQYGNYQYGQNLVGHTVQYGMNNYRVIGNGLLNNAGEIQDPVEFKDYKKTFFLRGLQPITQGQWGILVSLILAVKPLETVAVAEVTIQ